MPSTRPERPAGLDLMPVMNLVALLIPMLLVTAQAVGLAVIDSSVPDIVGDKEPTDPGLQLSLALTDQVPFEVLVRVMDASREQIGEEGTRSLFPAVVMAGGAE